jgi:dynein heavy chain
LDICNGEQYFYEPRIFESFMKLLTWPNDIGFQWKSSIANIKRSEEIFLARLDTEKSEFLIHIQEVAIKVELLKEFDDFSQFESYLPQIHELFEKFSSILKQVKSFNDREALFKLKYSNFEEVEELYNEFMPYFKIWDLAEQFETERLEWMT